MPVLVSRPVGQCMVLYQQQRGMANLKAIAMRLKSVKNIQKITQSMKMVSAAKYARAERNLKAARPYGQGAQAFYAAAEVKGEEKEKPKELYVALSSDRGLCGGIHSSICKAIRAELLEKDDLSNVGIICVGDLARFCGGRGLVLSPVGFGTRVSAVVVRVCV